MFFIECTVRYTNTHFVFPLLIVTELSLRSSWIYVRIRYIFWWNSLMWGAFRILCVYFPNLCLLGNNILLLSKFLGIFVVYLNIWLLWLPNSLGFSRILNKFSNLSINLFPAVCLICVLLPQYFHFLFIETYLLLALHIVFALIMVGDDWTLVIYHVLQIC